MICKRIRLTERRMKPPPQVREGPIARPCTSNLVNVSTAVTSPREKRVTINDPRTDENIEELSDNSTASATSSSHNQQSKTPLIVVTLSMPPETETLVPKLIKRQPRKPPSFCIQYSTQTKLFNDTKRIFEQQRLPEIYIQGVEMIEPKYDERESLTARSNGSKSSEELNSLVNNASDQSNPLDFFNCERNFLLNFDGYDLDVNGHLPGDTRTPSPTTSHGIMRACCMRRTPSPTTRQIIRVDVSLSKKNSRKK